MREDAAERRYPFEDSVIELFQPPRPPEVRAEDVSVRHVFMGTEPKSKLKRVYYVGRTAAQKARRQELARISKQLKRRQSDAARKMRTVEERLR